MPMANHILSTVAFCIWIGFGLDLSELSILVNTKRLEPTSYDNDEAKLENEVEQNSAYIFGAKSIYLPIKKKVSTKLSGRVTDALLLDLYDKESPRFWIVEIELASHSVKHHVQPQITGFVRALEEEGTRAEMVEILFDEQKRKPEMQELLREAARGEEIHKLLTDVIKGDVGVVIVADDITQQLADAVKDLSRYKGVAEVVPLSFRSFKNSEGTIFAFTPYSELELQKPSGENRIKGKSRKNWAGLFEWADMGGAELVNKVIAQVESDFPGAAHKPVGKYYEFYAEGLGKGKFLSIILSKSHLELRFGLPGDSPLASDKRLKSFRGWFFHSPNRLEHGMLVKTREDLIYASKFIRASYEAATGNA